MRRQHPGSNLKAKSFVRLALSSLTAVLCLTQAQADEPLVADPATYEATVAPFFEKHCVKCHGPEKEKGDLRLDTLTVDFADHELLGKWIEVMDNINLGEMPPEDEPIPSIEEIGPVAHWIAAEVRHAEKAARSTGGRVMIRRLSRSEYANTVRDLLHVNFLPGEGPADLLPPDGTLEGFDKVSKALLLDPSLMSQYFDVAAVVADKAIVTGPPPVPTRRNRMEYEDTSGGIQYIKEGRDTIVTDDGIITMNHGMRSDQMLRHPWNDQLIPVRGTYTVRLRVGADPGSRGEPIYLRLTRNGDGDLWAGKVTGTLEKPQIIEITRPFDVPGSDEIQVAFENPLDFQRVNYFNTQMSKAADDAIKSGDLTAGGRIRARLGAEGMIGQSRPEPDSRETDDFPRVFFDWIEVEGPLYDQWPPESTGALFTRGLEDRSQWGLDYAREIFGSLLPRAFRRPVSEEEIDRITGIMASEMEAGEPFPEAVKAGVIATLCSPSFLLLFEGSEESEARPLNDHEIATRLSYFLWSSLPDEALFTLAEEGKLSDPRTRAEQVDRMLADPRAAALVDGFATQWLKASEFDRFAIDRQLYRDYYAVENSGLNESINAEPLAFFREVLEHDLPATDFLDSDWIMANETLAAWYGIAGVSGADFRRVALPANSNRGGLVSMAAVHKWGSDGNRTKPVERGKYVLDVLFNDPPDPPPPNAGEVEPNVQGENLTVRQRLDQHRTIESCRACHARIDPYGLALENFNVIGKWRTQQDGERGYWPKEARIDPTGTFPNGRPYENVAEFRAGLVGQSDRFLRGLAEKMLTYALGRSIESTDRGTIDHLVETMKSNDLTFRSLIKGIAETEAFSEK
ncbi:MAG: DUF1592 domain-containing protein [Verrucomicrobiae bacterium]|nr:DUF1592 domain-containing protein [Verrucomicrobiae bacterium]